MRFDLFARIAPASDFAAVKAPKLGVWQKSAPGRVSSGFVFTQRVQGLTAPGSFRAQVRFRWYGSGGTAAALGHAHERDLQAARPARRTCAPAALTPIRTIAPGQASYELDGAQRRPHGRRPVRRRAHRRRGRAAARARARRPGPRRRPTTVTFLAPPCAPGSTLRFDLDAEDEVDESSEADDVVERACPFG